MQIPMHAMVNIAVRAAREAGAIMMRYVNRIEALEVVDKGRNQFVSEVDRLAEEAIIQVIHEYYPEHSILAEESGHRGEHEYQWIIDPLDGTTNYLHGFPVFAVSIAVSRAGQLEHGVVYDPHRQEIFSASRGQGAHLDNRRIRVSKRTRLHQALLATGLPYRANKEYLDNYIGMLKAVINNNAGVRRAGSAALDLCYVAAGRVDGFWELGLKPWDIAAGALIIREAGGRISDYRGTDRFLESAMSSPARPRCTQRFRNCLRPMHPTSPYRSPIQTRSETAGTCGTGNKLAQHSDERSLRSGRVPPPPVHDARADCFRAASRSLRAWAGSGRQARRQEPTPQRWRHRWTNRSRP